MITEIEIEGFKSLEKVRLKLGKFNLFVGANASGKSNFFDALRVLQGIGYGFTIDEIFNGRPKGASSEVWEGIRGGSPRSRFFGLVPRGSRESIAFRVGLSFVEIPEKIEYSIDISPERGVVSAESLFFAPELVFDRKGDESSMRIANEPINRYRRFREGSPAVGDPLLKGFIYYREGEVLERCKKNLSDMQRLGFDLQNLRGYGQLFPAKRMGEAGENFASLIKSILRDPRSKEAYLAWVQKLSPVEVEDVVILEGALGEPFFALKEANWISPAPILSDGTLLFAGIAAAFFQPDMPDIITIEEIENGIHPTRVRLLLELLKSQSGEDGPQVFATTHSPVVLAWLDESDYETTFFCKRDEETGASIIKPLSEIPHLVDLVKKQPLSELFMEGWMEGAF